MFRALSALKGNLVVSCQAAPGDPLDDVAALRRITLAAIRGGAGGLRLNGAECIAAVRADTDLPIIGIKKSYIDRVVRITPDFTAAAELAQAGADMIAVDCTDRVWSGGMPWLELIKRIHDELHLPVMADIATLEEALVAAAAGADSIGTTLNGYTETTRHNRGFDCKLLSEIVAGTELPVVAEGHISTPADARNAMISGAWCVVVGSAITRPASITARFADAVRNSIPAGPVIGVDIGGTSIKAGLVDRKGCISFPARIPTAASGGRESILAAMVQAIDHVLLSAREGDCKRGRN
jgi:putative N-acetylmannosamine-6-phosphate epimerase